MELIKGGVLRALFIGGTALASAWLLTLFGATWQAPVGACKTERASMHHGVEDKSNHRVYKIVQPTKCAEVGPTPWYHTSAEWCSRFYEEQANYAYAWEGGSDKTALSAKARLKKTKKTMCVVDTTTDAACKSAPAPDVSDAKKGQLYYNPDDAADSSKFVGFSLLSFCKKFHQPVTEP